MKNKDLFKGVGASILFAVLTGMALISLYRDISLLPPTEEAVRVEEIVIDAGWRVVKFDYNGKLCYDVINKSKPEKCRTLTYAKSLRLDVIKFEQTENEISKLKYEEIK